MKKLTSANRFLSLFLAFVMVLGMLPTAALAAETTTYAFGASNTQLAPGDYDLGVSLKKASDITADSMAASCITGGTLTVNGDGTAEVTVDLQAVTVGAVSDWASDWKVYQEQGYENEDQLVAASYTEKTVEDKTVQDSISFALPDNSWDGVYVNMYIGIMEMYQDAYLAFTYPAATETADVREGTASVEQFGKYDVTAKVTVEEGKVAGLEVEGSNFSGTYAETNQSVLAKAIEGLKEYWNGKDVTDAGEIYQVEAVSGATTSSKAIRDAVMDALELTYEEETITVPEAVEAGTYTVPVSYYTDVVLHYLTGGEKADAVLVVAEDGSMQLDVELVSGSAAEPLYLMAVNGYYKDNDTASDLLTDGMTAEMGDTDFSDTYFAEDTQIVTRLSVPLVGGLAGEYATNNKLYVPAMNKLNGEVGGVTFENGVFSVDSFIKIYWDDMVLTEAGEETIEIDFTKYEPGTYDVDADLSCYITAMGGVEFADSVYTGAQVTIAEDGTATLTLNFKTGSLTIYSITVDTYVGEGYYLNGAKADAVIGYQNKNDEWVTVDTYTMSGEGNTVTPSYNTIESAVQYITSLTIPVEEVVDTYQLAMVIDSSFMGMQFGGADSRYAATLTVDWSSFEAPEKNDGGGSGGSSGGNEDSFGNGNYYVDVTLWKKDVDKTSMGDAAFKNNRQALVTVRNGVVTKVQISTNPVQVGNYYSAITEIEIDGATVKVLDSEKITSRNGDDELGTYDYIKTFSFTMPGAGQPETLDDRSCVDVTFVVPDTPMDAAVGVLNARLMFDWSTAKKTSSSDLAGDSSTAKGTSSITGEEIADLELVDKATGIRIDTDTEALPGEAEISVTKITEGGDHDTAAKAMSGISDSWTLFEIITKADGEEIAPAGSVTVSIPCTEAGLTVYRVNDSGTKTVIKGSVKDGYYVFDTSRLGLFAVIGTIGEAPAVSASGFTDTVGHWAEKEIDAVVARGLYAGTSKTTFSPDVSMTRGMFVTVLGRLAGAEAKEVTESVFTDVDVDGYYAPFVAWAHENGIIKGTSETTFTPDRAISRQEMAVILARYAEFAGIDLKDLGAAAFADADQIGAWAAADVEKITRAGLLKGTGNGMFSPVATATRAQVAALLARFVEEYNL